MASFYFILLHYLLKKVPKKPCMPRYILMNSPGSGTDSMSSVGGCFSSSSFIIRSRNEGLVFGTEGWMPCINMISS